MKQWRKFQKRIKRFLRKRKLESLLIAGSFLFLIAITVFTILKPSTINPVAYEALLTTIARGESRGNYNAYYGNASNNNLRFTDMTINQVLQWQKDYVEQGSVSSAVGKYQIVKPTLEGLITELNVDRSQRFDAGLQDRLAIALIERRGGKEFVDKKISREQFAANLAKEWAALPKVIGTNPDQSYYAADGINQARLSIDDIFSALQPLARYREQS